MWPLLTLTAAAALVCAPLWLGLSVGLDVMRRQRLLSVTRGTLFFILYLQFQLLGVIAGGALFIAKCVLFPSVAKWHHWNRQLQNAWTKILFKSVKWVFSIRFDAEIDAKTTTGPFILFVRHVSIVDTLFPACFVSIPWQVPLQYVLKSGLLWDPCLDLIGQRLPNCFVYRGGKHSTAESERLASLALNLPESEGLIIFPEGTRATPKKRQEMLSRATETNNAEMLHQLALFKHVVPPRRPGVNALLANSTCDVVFLAHTGFEGIATLNDIWNGSLVGRHVTVKIWRTNRTQWPAHSDGQWAECIEQWKKVDAFIESKQRPAEPGEFE